MLSSDWLSELTKTAGGPLEAVAILLAGVLLTITLTIMRTRSALAKQIEASAEQQKAVTARFKADDLERHQMLEKITALEEQRDDLEQQIEGSTGVIAGLTERLKTSDNALNALKAEIDALRTKTAKVEQELAAIRQQKREAETQLEREKLRNLEQHKEIEVLRAQVVALEQRVAVLTGANDALTTLLKAWRVIEPKTVDAGETE